MGKKKKKKRISGKLILLLVILVFVLFLAGCAIKGYKLFNLAKETKHNAEDLVNCVLSGDIGTAESKFSEIEVAVEQFRDFFDSEIGKIGSSFICAFTKYDEDLENAKRLLEIAQEGMLKYKEPLFSRLKKYPINSLKKGEGYNAAMIASYVQLLSEAMPDAMAWMEEISSMNFNFEYNGLVAKYMGKLKEIYTLARNAEKYIPFLCDFFGDGSDKFYILAAQNSAEIRACGGFPGSMGIVKIYDGILTVGDFDSCWNILPYWTPNYDEFTYDEKYLSWWYVKYARDVEYLPDYTRVGYFWAKSYESIHDVHVDGVISLTPVIIQDLLGVIGEITLADGTVLTGNNATYWIQHGLYVKYENDEALAQNQSEADAMANALFAETAEATMAKLFDNINLSTIPKFLEIVEKRIADRVIMVWMADEEEQAYVKELGMDGGLCQDPEAAKVGLFLSNDVASKIGWYSQMDYKIDYSRKLSNGSNEYKLTVTITNTMTEAQMWSDGWWTAGLTARGVFSGIFLMYAPAGGQVYNMSSSLSQYKIEDYQQNGLDMAICLEFYLYCQRSITFTMYFTTAPGVETEPTVYQTPMLAEYRIAHDLDPVNY